MIHETHEHSEFIIYLFLSGYYYSFKRKHNVISFLYDIHEVSRTLSLIHNPNISEMKLYFKEYV